MVLIVVVVVVMVVLVVANLQWSSVLRSGDQNLEW